jgi:XTP/dITP diphosphohydrolase
VIATHNPGKLAEMRELLAPYGIEAVSAGELGLPEPDETGNTFAANARIKAVAAAKATAQSFRPSPTIPVWWSMRSTARRASIRRAGPDRPRISAAMTADRDPAAGAWRETPEQRKAHFVSALCVAWPDDHLEESRPRRWHAGMAAARQRRFRLRPGCSCPTATTAPSAK